MRRLPSSAVRLGHAILMRQTGNPLYPPSQPGCPTPPIHSSLGVVEVVLPRAELARFATARALLESMRFGPLGPISVPDTELARWARGAVEGLLSGEGLSLQPKLFADGVRDVVCRDELGNPLDEADPWEVATDSDPPDTWAGADGSEVLHRRSTPVSTHEGERHCVE